MIFKHDKYNIDNYKNVIITVFKRKNRKIKIKFDKEYKDIFYHDAHELLINPIKLARCHSLCAGSLCDCNESISLSSIFDDNEFDDNEFDDNQFNVDQWTNMS
jgi:hypothetical protein